MRSIYLIGVLLGIIAGILSSGLRWGDESRIHGKGWPIPVVVFVDGKDYVGILGYILNPAIFALSIFLLIGLFQIVVFLCRKLFTNRGTRGQAATLD